MIDIDLRFIGTLSDNELHRLLKKENHKELEERSKVYHAGKASQEELDEIDQCRLCEIMPELEKTCYATAYCHRQMRMELDTVKP